jgi:sugar fermentation stimulation protein A
MKYFTISSTNTSKNHGLHWPKLIEGTLVKRYKRFMADVLLSSSGQIVTAHCPNSGSMKTCCDPGRPVYLSESLNPARRLHYTWELIEMPTSLVGVNTSVPNRLVRESIQNGVIPEFREYETVRAEVPCGSHSRLDLMLERPDNRCFIEIKNCTLIEGTTASFPDAITARGLKHLVKLQELVDSGDRAVIFFLVQRSDATEFKPADHIDPKYGRELRSAVSNGVEVFCYDVTISLAKISLNKPIPVLL